MTGQRFVVVGFDAASPELIEPWAKNGVLPTFQDLLSSGSYGRLRSTIPPHSGPAWPSAITGRNPGKHGIFGFVPVKPPGPTRILTSNDMQGPAIYDILNRHGRKAIMVNVPMTYPPKRIDGIFVSGLFTPSDSVEFVHPPELKSELLRLGYEVEFSANSDFLKLVSHEDKSPPITVVKERRKKYFERLMNAEDKLARVFLHLLQNHDWDFAMVVFVSLDRVQHVLWKPLGDEETTLRMEPYWDCSTYILNAYRRADSNLKLIRDTLPSGVPLAVISDHGFRPVSRKFLVNSWLSESKMLFPRTEVPRSGRIKRRIPKAVRTVAKKVLRLRDRPMSRFMRNVSFSDNLDLSRTKLYAPVDRCIVLNEKAYGAIDGDSLLQAIAEALVKVRDPETGSSVVSRAYLKREAYSGPFIGLAPDLVLEAAPGYKMRRMPMGGNPWADAGMRPSDHSDFGIVFLNGLEFEAGKVLPRAGICDIVPTILLYLGYPIPDDVDGRPLIEALKTDSPLLSKQPAYESTAQERDRVSEIINRMKSEGRI